MIKNEPKKESNNEIRDEREKENANKCLPSFLINNSEEEDSYFKDSDDEQNDDNQESNSLNIINNIKNYQINNSYSNFGFENSTKDNSFNNFINNSKNNNNLYNNNSPQFNPNQNFYFGNNNPLNFNQNNLQNLPINNNNINFFNNNNFINNNNPNSSNNNYSFNSFNSFNNNNNISMGNNIPMSQSWNSFNGLSPITSINFSNNNYMPILPFNNDDQNNKNKCLSFNQNNSRKIKNLFECKIVKYKQSKSDKFNLDDNNLNAQVSPVKKIFDMSNQALYKYIITQKGSREVQNLMRKMKKNELELLIIKLKNYISEITMDKYGNYFTQILIQICLPAQRIQVLKCMKNNFLEIANSSFGTHPLQSLIEIVNMPEEKQLILSYILGNESILALDPKGNHVLQKFISCTKDEERKELNINLINLIDKLITDPSGVCVLNILIKNTNDKSICQKIANYITQKGPLTFIQHPYANYVVQKLINSTDLSYCDSIINTIVENYLSLSIQKFSSNVVENCIKYGNDETVNKIYKNIIEKEKLESLLNNNYGNFVLEKLISRLNKEEKLVFFKKIEKIGKNKNISNNIKNLLHNNS